MPRKRPDRCRRCGQAADRISKRGNCGECQVELQTFAATELHHKEGPVYNTWVERMREVVAEL